MNTLYTYSQARQNFASILKQACRQGEVRLKRRDGQIFIIKPEPSKSSPLDVAGVDTDLTAEEIVKFVRKSRQSTRSKVG